jgi:hypothetical protein
MGEDEEWEAVFYASFDEQWYTLVDESYELEWQTTWDLIWQPIWDQVAEQAWPVDDWEEDFEEDREEDEVSIGDFEWDVDFEVPDSDWYNDFADEVDVGLFFPDEYVDEDGTTWSCDYDDWCVYYDEPLAEYCDNDGDCYTFDETVQYFYGEWIHWEEQGLEAWDQTGTTNWGHAQGWCVSDLDAHIGYFNDIEECWGACTHVFGDVVYSVDFWAYEGEMGSCYCQHDCFCMESIGYEDCETMTLDSLV